MHRGGVPPGAPTRRRIRTASSGPRPVERGSGWAGRGGFSRPMFRPPGDPRRPACRVSRSPRNLPPRSFRRRVRHPSRSSGAGMERSLAEPLLPRGSCARRSQEGRSSTFSGCKVFVRTMEPAERTVPRATAIAVRCRKHRAGGADRGSPCRSRPAGRRAAGRGQVDARHAGMAADRHRARGSAPEAGAAETIPRRETGHVRTDP